MPINICFSLFFASQCQSPLVFHSQCQSTLLVPISLLPGAIHFPVPTIPGAIHRPPGLLLVPILVPIALRAYGPCEGTPFGAGGLSARGPEGEGPGGFAPRGNCPPGPFRARRASALWQSQRGSAPLAGKRATPEGGSPTEWGAGSPAGPPEGALRKKHRKPLRGFLCR